MEKIHKKLITVDIAFDDMYVDLHSDITINEAINKVKSNSSITSFALPPEKMLELAKTLIDAVFISKSKSENEKER